MNKKPTKQGVSSRSGTAPPKHTQFGQPNGNPRHNGAWKKKDTPRYKLEQMMKLTAEELKNVAESEDTPVFERKIALAIQDGSWKEIESMINQVYGAPKQTVEGDIGVDMMHRVIRLPAKAELDEPEQD